MGSNMESYLLQKIEEVYQVALQLGVENASEIEKKIFKKSLSEIATVAHDDMRRIINQALREESSKFS